MPESNAYKIKYKSAIPIFLLTASIFILATTLVTGFSVNTVTALILLLVSLLMLSNPIAVVTASEVQIRNLLGMTVKTHSFGPNEISLQEDGLYVNNKKVVSSFIASIDPQLIQVFARK